MSETTTSSGRMRSIEICPGSHLLQIPEADIAWVFNPWPDITKYIIQKELHINGVVYPDRLVQGGVSCNMIEFPLLYCIFHEKMHWRGEKPSLVGDAVQLRRAAESFKRGLYGYYKIDEMEGCDLSLAWRRQFMREIKALSLNGIQEPDAFLEMVKLNPFGLDGTEGRPTNHRGVSIRKLEINVFEFEYKGERMTVNGNLQEGVRYVPPLKIDVKNVDYKLFQIIDSGEEDGFSPKSCMHTLIQWRDKIVCVDLPMNTQYLLEKLSISKNQIEAVIFTHNHDDHIGDLSLLLQLDKKAKVICPRIVWKSILLKASDMLDMTVKELEEYFEYIPIRFGEEYDYCGLRILAHPSIHPVPCAIYRIRAMIDNEWKTYAHLSDILNLKRAKKLMKDGVVSERRYERYKRFLLDPADVKKVDVGTVTGSELVSVHGHWADFRRDKSDRIIFGHIREEALETEATAVVGQFAQVGSARDMSDRNPASYNDKLRERAVLLLADYLLSLLEREILTSNVKIETVMDYMKILADNDIELIQPNTPYLKQGKRSTYTDLIVTGLGSVWSFEEGRLNYRAKVQTGDLIGEMGALNDAPRNAFVRSDTYMSVLRIPAPQFREAACVLGLYDPDGRSGILQKIWKNREALQSSACLSDGAPVYLQNKISQRSFHRVGRAGERLYPLKEDDGRLATIGDNVRFDVYVKGRKWKGSFGPPVFNLSGFLGLGGKENYEAVLRQNCSVLETPRTESEWMLKSPLLRMRLTQALRLRRLRLGSLS